MIKQKNEMIKFGTVFSFDGETKRSDRGGAEISWAQQ